MERKTFPLQRWLNVVLRGLHLAAVVWLGAALLGAPVDGARAASAVAVTGVVMFALDTWSRPSHLRETSGIAVLIKLAFVGWMAVDASSRFLLFWGVVGGSAVFAHAPARFRHAVLFPGRR